jgi:hypothetical protein
MRWGHIAAGALAALGTACTSGVIWRTPECEVPGPACSDGASCATLARHFEKTPTGIHWGGCWTKVVSDLASKAGPAATALQQLCDDRDEPGEYLVGCTALAQQDANASKQLAASANWRVLTNVLALGGGGNETLRQAAS